MTSFFTAIPLALLLAQPSPTDPPKEARESAHWTNCAAAIEWIYAAEVPNTEGQLIDLVMKQQLVPFSQRWIREAIQKGPSLQECCARAKGERKLVLWYIPAVEGQHIILPHLIDRYMMVGPWSDPDVAQLINRRFVPLKMPCGGTLAARYNVRAPAFIEPGFLVLDGDGGVVHRMNRINTFGSDYFEAILVQILEANKKDTGASASRTAAKEAWEQSPALETALVYATECEADGEWKIAESVAKEHADDARAKLLLARLARRERDGKKALRLLDEISGEIGKTDDAALLSVVAAERGLVQLRLGEFTAAQQTLRSIASDAPRAAEAQYYLGAIEYLTRRDAEAVNTWKAAAAAHPKSVWGAKSHAYSVIGTDGARGEGPLTRSMEDLRWVDDAAYELQGDTQWRRSAKEARKIAARAVEFLLLEQRADGSWVGPRWGGPGEPRPDRPCNIQKAISALAANALLDWRSVDKKEIDAALERADAYLLDESCVDRDDIIWVYADAYRLLYFAKRLKKLPKKQRREVRETMQGWVDHVVRQQKNNNGPFQHYTYTSTFVTATVTYCLHRARAAGVEVADSVFEASARVLEGARGSNGLYGYLIDAPQVGRSMKGAGGRQPLCDWTLSLCGRSGIDLNRSMQVFFDSYRSSTELARKSNFHVPSLDNTAGYYFFHNFYAAAEAAAASGKQARSNKRKLLELLCELPEVDGTFVDAGFSYGKSYSTAMALMSMRLLVR